MLVNPKQVEMYARYFWGASAWNLIPSSTLDEMGCCTYSFFSVIVAKRGTRWCGTAAPRVALINHTLR